MAPDREPRALPQRPAPDRDQVRRFFFRAIARSSRFCAPNAPILRKQKRHHFQRPTQDPGGAWVGRSRRETISGAGHPGHSGHDSWREESKSLILIHYPHGARRLSRAPNRVTRPESSSSRPESRSMNGHFGSAGSSSSGTSVPVGSSGDTGQRSGIGSSASGTSKVTRTSHVCPSCSARAMRA